MKVTIKVVNVYSEILEEVEKDILVIRDEKKYLGCLLDKESYWVDEVIKETLNSTEIEGTIEEVIEAIIEMRKVSGLTTYDSSKSTMAWWGYLNGLFDEYIKVA